MRKIRASVLIAVYNDNLSYLKKAFDSILNQSFSDYELLILNDGSNNQETINFLSTIERVDCRIKLLNFLHSGLTRTLNNGLHQAKTDIIFRHDSDDWSEPNRFQLQFDFLKYNLDFSLVGSQLYVHDENGKKITKYYLPLKPINSDYVFKIKNPFCHGATCFRKSSVLKLGGYRDFLTTSQDYDLFWRLCEKEKALNLPEFLYHFRVSSRSISSEKALEQQYNRILITNLSSQRVSGNEDLESAKKNTEYQTKIDKEIDYKKADRFFSANQLYSSLYIYLKALVRKPLRLMLYLKIIRVLLVILFPFIKPLLVDNGKSIASICDQNNS